jgi:hypothetical protein
MKEAVEQRVNNMAVLHMTDTWLGVGYMECTKVNKCGLNSVCSGQDPVVDSSLFLWYFAL